MTNNKQQTAVDELWDYLKGWIPQGQYAGVREAYLEAKEMEKQQKEMSYADGYAEGYKRALEMIEWYIKNHISGMPQDHIGDTNKMI